MSIINYTIEAEELMKNPDFEIKFYILKKTNNKWGIEINFYSDIHIGDIGYSDKIIILTGKGGK